MTTWYWAPLASAVAAVFLGAFLKPVAEWATRYWILLYTLRMNDRDLERGDAWEFVLEFEADLAEQGYRPGEIGLRLLAHLVRSMPGDLVEGLRISEGGLDGLVGNGVLAALIVGLGASWLYASSGSRFIALSCWLVAATGVTLLGARIDYRRWRGLSWQLLGTALVMLILVVLPQLGHEVNGARSSFAVWSGVNIIPGEFVWMPLVMFSAAWLSGRRRSLSNFTATFVPFMALFGLVVDLLMGEPLLGLSFALLALCLAIWLFAGGSLWQLVGVWAGAVPVAVILSRTSRYRHDYISNFIARWADPGTLAHHTLGGLLSTHSGDSRGALALALLLFACAYHGFRVYAQTRDGFGRLLAAGVSARLILQALASIGSLMSPFSAPGSASPIHLLDGETLLALALGIGVLRNVSRTGSRGPSRCELKRLRVMPSEESRGCLPSSSGSRWIAVAGKLE